MKTPALLRRHPSALLLAFQLVSLMLYPLTDDNEAGRVLFGAIGLVAVCLSVWVVNRSPSRTWVALLLGIPAVLITLIALLLRSPTLLVCSALLESALYFYAAGSLISYMMHDHRVTSDEYFAAGATFTLLAWGFAYAFFVCQSWYPDSFTGVRAPAEPRRWMELLFLSFTTLSGVGIGDVVPIGMPARALVMLEQFAGIGYIAVVVSRLIGLGMLRVARSEARSQAEKE
jgi:Ion channel